MTRYHWNVHLRSRSALAVELGKSINAAAGRESEELPDPIIVIERNGDLFATIYMTEKSGYPGIQICSAAPGLTRVATINVGKDLVCQVHEQTGECPDELCTALSCDEHPTHKGSDHTYQQHHDSADHVGPGACACIDTQ